MRHFPGLPAWLLDRSLARRRAAGADSDSLSNGCYPFHVPSPDPSLLQRLREAMPGGLPLRLAVLFGSRATGPVRDDSDVDLGIIPCDPELVLGDELGEASRLSGLLGLEIDLVRLDQDNPLLGREVSLTKVFCYPLSA